MPALRYHCDNSTFCLVVWAPHGQQPLGFVDNPGPGRGVPDDGAYVYTTTFDTTSLDDERLAGIWVFADDTVDVFLNSTADATGLRRREVSVVIAIAPRPT